MFVKIKNGGYRILINLIGYSSITFAALICVIPFILVLSGSFSSEQSIHFKGYNLWPSEFSLDAYSMVFRVPQMIIKAYSITVVLTVVGSILGLFMCTLT